MNSGKTPIEGECDATMQVVAEILQTSREDFLYSPSGVRLQRLVEHMVQDGARRGGGPREDPVHEVFSLIGDKWSSLVVLLLGAGNFRHTVLRRLVCTIANKEISQRVLTSLLRSLERDGMVLRRVLATMPPGVEYSLTPMGHELLGEIEQLMQWIHRRSDQIRAAQAAFKNAESDPGEGAAGAEMTDD